jgi:hypothetical protein
VIFHRSRDVPQFSDYLDYRDPYLRPDFEYRCAYCLTHEHYFLDGEAGEVDHFRPLHPPNELGKDFSHLRTVYDNLYWSCPTCNLNKGNRWPTDAQYASGERFLDPCLEDHDTHWETHLDGTISATTPTGRYTIRNIRLDRPRLNKRRAEFLKDRQKLTQILRHLEQAAITPEHRQTLLEHLEDVREHLNPSVWIAAPPISAE